MSTRDAHHNETICPTNMQRLAQVRLAQTGYPRLRKIDCAFHQGTITLRGRVPSYYHKQVAQTALRSVAHVARVVNHLKVSS